MRWRDMLDRPARRLAAQLGEIWSRGVRAREADTYDREVGVRAACAAQAAFMGEIQQGRADYRSVSRGIRAVLRYLDKADERQFVYAGPTAAVGGSLREVLNQLNVERPNWMKRRMGLPQVADAWMQRAISLSPEACVQAGRSDEERIGYLLAALSRWRADTSAWAALRGEHALHDGVFDSAKGSFEWVAEQLIEQLSQAPQVPVEPLRTALTELIDAPPRFSKESDAARKHAARFARAVLATCGDEVNASASLDHARRASMLRLFQVALRCQRCPTPPPAR